MGTVTPRTDFSDQLEIFDPRHVAGTVLNVIGCGGIGGSILPLLVTMGFGRYILWDDDVMDERNVASTIAFRPSDIGRPKVEVLEEYLRDHGAGDIETHQRLFGPDSDQLEGLVVSGVDSMVARQTIWPAIAWNPLIPLYLDGRIGGQQLTLLVVEPFDPDQVEWYEGSCLLSDSETLPLPCAARSVAYSAAALGPLMGAMLAAWSRGDPLPRRIDQSLAADFSFRVLAR